MVVPLEAVTLNDAVPRIETAVFVGWTVMTGGGPLALQTPMTKNVTKSQLTPYAVSTRRAGLGFLKADIQLWSSWLSATF
jgi:hypothetical protein